MRHQNMISVIVPAAGSGSRLNSKIPKPYVMLAGRPLIIHTLKMLEKKIQHRCETLVAVEKESVSKMNRMIQRYALKRCRAIEGGETRAESVKKTFDNISTDSRLVVIHDGARPFLSREPIELAVKQALKGGAVILAKSADATVKQVTGAAFRIQSTLDRRKIFLAQTPQIFKVSVLKKAYKKIGKRYFAYTDESGLVESAGFPVKVVPATSMNFKITTPEDLAVAKLLMKFKTG